MPSSVFLSARRQPSPFASEADMTAIAIGVAQQTWWRSSEQLDFLATEVVASGAIADVVAASFDTASVLRRARANLSPLTDLTAIVCASFCHEPTAVGDVVDYTGLSRSGASRSLGLAVECGALVRDGRRFVVNDGWESPVHTVVAAELKLRDWQKGLAQAVRYRRWADASWLILGATTTLESAKEAAPSGIGVLRLTTEGQVQKARVARWRRPTNLIERIWVGEQILKQALAAGWRPELKAPATTFAGAPAFALN
jgi:hypothetical protein